MGVVPAIEVVVVVVVDVVVDVSDMVAAAPANKSSNSDILWLTNKSLLTAVAPWDLSLFSLLKNANSHSVSSVRSGLRSPSLSAIAPRSCQVSSISWIDLSRRSSVRLPEAMSGMIWLLPSRSDSTLYRRRGACSHPPKSSPELSLSSLDYGILLYLHVAHPLYSFLTWTNLSNAMTIFSLIPLVWLSGLIYSVFHGRSIVSALLTSVR